MRPVGRPESLLKRPLSSILGTEANVRTLRELALHGGELSAPVLAERTGVSPQQMRVALAGLVAAGAVEALGSGRVRLYRIDKGYPLATALLVLFRTEEERFQAILSALRQAIGKAGPAVHGAWLYGSVVRGNDAADSDLDLAVVADENELEDVVETVREELAAAAERLRFRPSVIGTAPSDIRRLARERDPWWQTVSGDAVPLVGLSPGKLARTVVEAS
jgi:predicted nucleotidyltransferase